MPTKGNGEDDKHCDQYLEQKYVTGSGPAELGGVCAKTDAEIHSSWKTILHCDAQLIGVAMLPIHLHW